MTFKRVIVVLLWVGAFAAGAAQATEVTVYKSPTCGCCTSWVKHMEVNGFKVKAQNVMDMDAVKRRHGVSPNLASCHTALIDGYVIEGHVPASDIRRLLKERPKVKGLAVPGMPQSAPGMDSPIKQPYQTLSFDGSGHLQVFANH